MPPKRSKTPPPLPKDERRRLRKLLQFETKAWKAGYERVAGVDEAGRGPLAGPVVAAACVVPRGVVFEGINDSKLLTEKKRRSLFERLTDHKSVQFGIAIVGEAIIDEINIYRATVLAMHQAVENLGVWPDYLLVDAVALAYRKFPCEVITKGDMRSQSIAAASIIAKETRDEIMMAYHRRYPEYGFDRHKGYGTEFHRKALKEYGPSPIHRLSFEPH